MKAKNIATVYAILAAALYAINVPYLFLERVCVGDSKTIVRK